MHKYKVVIRRSKQGMIIRSFWCNESELYALDLNEFTTVYVKNPGKRIKKIQ